MPTRCLGGFSIIWVTKLLISPVKKGFFAQKRPNLAQNWHFGSYGPGHAGFFSALLAVVARGLYLARHLFTLLCQSTHLELCACISSTDVPVTSDIACFNNLSRSLHAAMAIFLAASEKSFKSFIWARHISTRGGPRGL